MAEEVANSSTAVPQSMLTAILVNGGMGFGILLAFLFTAGDIDGILKSSSAYPFINIIESATGSKSCAIVLASMVSALQICAGLAGISSGGRMLWAFSRERAIPGWQWISQVLNATPKPKVDLQTDNFSFLCRSKNGLESHSTVLV